VKGREAERQISQLNERLERAEEHIAQLGRRRQRNAGLMALGLLVWPLALPIERPIISAPWLAYSLVATYFLAMVGQLAIVLGFNEDDQRHLLPPPKKRPDTDTP
jgi:hypothetical protein